jgi:hypothetical protein
MSVNSSNNIVKKFRLPEFVLVFLLLIIAIVCIDMFRHDLLFTFNLQNVEPVGTVVVRKNTVQRRLGDRVLWDRLDRQSPVYLGDTIRVADISAATLYIQGSSIDLEANTLVRIISAPDGESIQIVLSQGTVSFFAGDQGANIILDLNGQQLRPMPGVILNATVTEAGEVSSNIIENILRDIPAPDLLSPVFNSNFNYYDSLPVLFFQWTEVEEAVSYILEVCRTSDFTNPQLLERTSSVIFIESNLGEGTWFWRVTPVIPSIYSSAGISSSSTGFFRIESAVPGFGLDFSQWLLSEAPSMQLPPEVPAELIPAHFVQEPPEPPPPEPPPLPEPPPPEPPPLPEPPPPPALLAAPGNLRPVRGSRFGIEEFQATRAIVFRWSPVQEANAYIFTFFQQTASGRRQIIQTTVRGTSYSFNNLRILDRGNFIWQIEAVNMGRGNVINRRGRVGESTFVIDFPSPSPIIIEDTGILYGN